MNVITIFDALIFLALAAHLLARARSTGQPALRRLAWFLTAGVVSVPHAHQGTWHAVAGDPGVRA